MGLSLITIFTVSALSLISANNASDKLRIDIHYESRCPDSRNFIQQQLRKVYPLIRHNAVIRYVPFGKANSFSQNGKTMFSCQHGARECEGNVFQSCALDVIGADQDKQTSFVICAMDFNKNPTNCAQNMGLDMKKINDCSNGKRGTFLQLEAEEFSRHIIGKSNFVPTIVFQGMYKAGDQWAAIDDLESVAKEQMQKLS